MCDFSKPKVKVECLDNINNWGETCLLQNENTKQATPAKLSKALMITKFVTT